MGRRPAANEASPNAWRRFSGSSGWRLVLAVLAGLAVGGLVLALQIVLQPGKAASGGGL